MRRLAGRQQLLAGELRRGVQIERRARPVRPDRLGREGVQMRLVAGRDLQRRRFDLDEVRARRNKPRTAARMRLRAMRNGRRSAWTCGVHQGDASREGRGIGLRPGARTQRLAIHRKMS